MENTEQTQEQLSALLQVRRDKLTELQNDGRDPFKITKFERTHTSAQLKENYTEEDRELKKRGSDEVQIIKAQVSQFDGQTVSIAGRIMSKRGMGKVGFVHVSDIDGQIQLFVKKDILGEDEYARFKKLDIGDIIGAEGEVFTTQTGEISVRAEKITLLSKSLLPLPEKFHGMTDTDLRYRQRYIDLIMNADVKKTFINRSKIIASIRSYLNGQNFLEVETPMLVANAGGAAARPFETHFNALDEDFKLRISLELYLKRLIVGGFDKVYEIGRVFRNEGLDTRHNPEFTLMELYQAYRITMVDAVKKYAGVDFNEINTLEEARKVADEHHVEYEDRHKKGDILNLFFEEYAEEHLIQPTFVMDHPVEISPLTKKKPENPDYVERFEFFMNGWEMANAYSELNDPIDQRERFKAQEELLAQGDEEANTTDEDFMRALEIGMPPTGGIGFGIDRMCMLLTDSPAIRDVLLFPTMKPLNDVNK